MLLVALTGCDKYMDTYSCLFPDKGHRDALNNPDPCHYNDPDSGTDAGAEPSCETGQFAHWLHAWESPSWVWIGPEDQAPECPQGPTSVSYEGHADLVAPALCEACTCAPPTGSCSLPSTITASDAACGTQGTTTSFNAPSIWDGSCDSSAQVPGGAAQSLSIDPIVMKENGCASGPPAAAKIVSLHWNTFARGCDVSLPKSLIERSTCLPVDPIAPGFKACIFSVSETECPNELEGNVFIEKHTFFHGVQDDRQCSTCTCGAPTGSLCTAQLAVYDGASCSGEPLMSNPISSTKAPCFDVAIPGQAFGSKRAEAVTYLPGTCPPEGGVASGTASPTIPVTVCCRP